MARFLLGAAAYVIPTFALGIIWHLVTFADVYQTLQIYRDDLVMPFGFASMAIQGCVYSAVYRRLLAGTPVMIGALRFGAVAATLAWTYGVLAVAAKHHMTSVSTFLMIETAFTAVQYIIVSPLIALAWRQPASNHPPSETQQID